MIINKRYVDLNINDLSDGTYILDAHLGSGKSTLLKQLKGKKVLYITHRNQLLFQIQKRFCWITTHITNNNSYKLPFQLKDIEALAINYSSLKKLSLEDRIIWDYIIIDEAFGIWVDSTTYRPDRRNEAEFKHLLKTTKKVIYMGGDFPDFLKNEIKEIASNRDSSMNTSVEEITYRYKTDNGIPCDFVYGEDGTKHRNMFINRQMNLRQKRRELLAKEDSFFIIEGEETEEDYYKRIEEEEIKNTKGVLITTEYAGGVKSIYEMWQDAYPDLRIEYIYAENVKDFPDYDELIAGLSDPEHYSDIDMLIVSPTWSVGINIVNEFELIVGDYVRNKGMPLHPRDIFQSMHRERNPKHYVIQLRAGVPPERYETLPDWTNRKDLKTVREACESLGFPISKYEIRGEDGTITLDNNMMSLYMRAIEVIRDNVFSRTNRTLFLWQMFKSSGAVVRDWDEEYKKLNDFEAKQYDYTNLPRHQLSKLKERLTGKEPHNKVSRNELGKAIKLLDLPQETEQLTEEQFYRYDYGNILLNYGRRKELEDSTQSDESDSIGISLVKRITRLMIMINKITEEKYLSTEMIFYSKNDLNYIKKNKDRYEALLKTYMNQPIPNFSTPENPKILDWLEEILRKHFYLVEIKSGGCRKNYEAKAIKEVGKRRFDTWKKEYKANNNVEGYLKIYDYLFIGLTDKSLKWNELGKDTKAYLKSFPHLIIKDNTEDFQRFNTPHY